MDKSQNPEFGINNEEITENVVHSTMQEALNTAENRIKSLKEALRKNHISEGIAFTLIQLIEIRKKWLTTESIPEDVRIEIFHILIKNDETLWVSLKCRELLAKMGVQIDYD